MGVRSHQARVRVHARKACAVVAWCCGWGAESQFDSLLTCMPRKPHGWNERPTATKIRETGKGRFSYAMHDTGGTAYHPRAHRAHHCRSSFLTHPLSIGTLYIDEAPMQWLLKCGTSFCENFSSMRTNAPHAVAFWPTKAGYSVLYHDMAKTVPSVVEGGGL